MYSKDSARPREISSRSTNINILRTVHPVSPTRHDQMLRPAEPKRCSAAAGTNSAPPSISIGGNSSTYDDLIPNQALTGVVTTNKMFAWTPSFAAATYAQGANINFKVNTAATGYSTLTYDIDIFGELV